MFRWIENIKKSITGKNKKNKKKAKDASDVNLDQLGDTKVLNVAQKPPPPKNRRLPKRPNRNEQANQCNLNNNTNSNPSSLTSSYDQAEEIKQPKDESPIIQHQSMIPKNQFKPNLNELSSCKLKANKRTSESKESDLNNQTKSNETGNQFALNKVRASSMSILDDNQEKSLADKINMKVNEDKIVDQDVVDAAECNEANNVKQRRAQLMHQLKQIEIKNKCKSMVSLNQTDFRNESLEQMNALKANKSNDYLNRADSNSRLNMSDSNSRMNLVGRTHPKLESTINKINLNKVASLNSLNNLNTSRSNLVNTGDNFKVNLASAQQSVNQPPAIPVKPLRKTTANSAVIVNVNSNVSRNNSSSSNKSYSSTNSESANSGNSANQSIEYLNGKSTAESSSILKKRINSKKGFGRFQSNDDEASQVKPEVPGVHLLNRTKFSNKVNRNRASLNLHNNNLDELTKKFMERGLSESVGSLKMMSDEQPNGKENDRSELEKADLLMPTYV